MTFDVNGPNTPDQVKMCCLQEPDFTDKNTN